jgi:hypothetical protein
MALYREGDHMGSSADTRVKIDGQRRAILEHIEKYNRYPMKQDKDFALKTIRNAQSQIQSLRGRHPQIPADPIDTWKPE